MGNKMIIFKFQSIDRAQDDALNQLTLIDRVVKASLDCNYESNKDMC